MNFAGYEYVATLMIFAEIAVIFLAYKRRPVWAIYAILLSIFLKGQYLWLGRPIYAWQIISIFGFAMLMMHQTTKNMLLPCKSLASYRLSILAFFAYTYLISIPLWLIFSAEGLGDIGMQVSASRVITQTIYFAFLIGLFGIGLWSGKFLTAINFLRATILIATIVAYGAIVQLLVMRYTGINIFPIIGSDGTFQSAYIGEITFRTTSFAGEPKHLGILMATGLIYCFLARLLNIPLGGRLALHKPLAMFSALLLSLSTTGFALVAAGIVVAAALYFRRIRGLDLVLIGVVVLAFSMQLIGVNDDFFISLLSQLSKMEIEVQDQSVVQGLLNEPIFLLTGTGLGNIHMFAVDYLPPDFPLFRDHGYKANSGLWFVIGDSGLIGLLFLLAGPLFGLQGYVRVRKSMTPEQRQDAMTALAIVLMSLVSFLLRYDVLFFLISGFAVTRLAMLRTATIVGAGGRSYASFSAH